MTDQERFQAACQKIVGQERPRKQIGTLGEKTLHAVIKEYLSPWAENQEVPLGPFHADIVDQNGITEIQTRNFGKLREKLNYFLPLAPVTVAYPIPRIKYLVWVDPETGEASPRRKSPKIGMPWDCCRELYAIRSLLPHPNLRIQLLMIDLCEYRSLCGWGAGGKRGSQRLDRIPLGLGEEIFLETAGDYQVLLPDGLPGIFDRADFQKLSRLSDKQAFCALSVLCQVGICKKAGKQGRRHLYEKVEQTAPGDFYEK